MADKFTNQFSASLSLQPDKAPGKVFWIRSKTEFHIASFEVRFVTRSLCSKSHDAY